MTSFGARKARVHGTGATNRGCGWRDNEGPRDFDPTWRSTLPRNITYKNDKQVPICPDGEPNLDFSPKLSGQTYRMPNSDPTLARDTKRREKEATARATADAAAAAVPTIHATRDGALAEEQAPRAAKNRGFKAAPRWNPDKWFQKPHYDQPPLQKEEGETWNSLESDKLQGEIKGQDRLMRTVRRPEDVATPLSDAGGRHPLNYDREEYYPGRSLIDVKLEEAGNDFQVRPTHLPDMFNPPAAGADPIARTQRLREMLKQRYAGRPGLLGVFKGISRGRNGYLYHADLVTLLDGMGCKVSEDETRMLLGSVDKDQKGAVNFEEFCDLIYGQNVKIGGKPHEVQERYVRDITKNLMDSLIQNGQVLGKTFCDVDPERQYMISKKQFAYAVGSSANHVSQQAIDFLWASQFPTTDSHEADKDVLDWRSFMAQLGHFAHANRRPTPCFLQGRKRQYDLLQRTAAVTGGILPDVELAGQQDDGDDVVLVADQLRHRKNQLQAKPRDVPLLTEHYAELLRAKADRTEQALPKRVPKARLKQLLRERKMVHQDELTELLFQELEQPHSQPALEAKAPLYAQQGPADVLTLDADGLASAAHGASPPPRGRTAAGESSGQPATGAGAGQPPAFLKLVRGDVEAYVAAQNTDRDHQVNVAEFLDNLYKPVYERRAIDKANDGLNRALRRHCPERERPPDSEVPRYENYWQARVMMEALGDAVAAKESSNGGNLKPSKLFKRLDMDNDGWISLSDMRSALEKYKVPHTTADLHSLFSQLDGGDSGAVNIGVFTRNYETASGNLMDSMAKPVKAVLHEGGVQYSGPIQDAIDEKERRLQERADHQMGRLQASEGGARAGERSESAPPATGSDRSRRSHISRTGANILAAPATPLIYETQVAQMTGSCRVSDAIRSRFSAWKAQKSELYTSLPKSRYGLTDYHDTRHVTEPSVPLSGQFMPDGERFKTTNNVMSVFSVPDHAHPQASDDLRKHSTREFKVERIRERQRDFSERCWAANEAAQAFDDKKMAHKALKLMDYERKCRMACN